jgi:hypothetical protein
MNPLTNNTVTSVMDSSGYHHLNNTYSQFEGLQQYPHLNTLQTCAFNDTTNKMKGLSK